MSTAPVREIAGPAGPLEALLDEAEGPPRALCVFAHPHPLYGGTMHTRAVYQTAKALTRIGVATLRFNFRGVGRSRGTHDGGPGEMDDYRAAVEFMTTRHPGLPVWAGGFSFGGWVSWTVGLDDPRVHSLVGVGLPVNRFDFSPVTDSAKPKFLIHGELDELVPIAHVRSLYGAMREPKDLLVIDGADHLFAGRTTELADAVEGLLGDSDTEGRV